MKKQKQKFEIKRSDNLQLSEREFEECQLMCNYWNAGATITVLPNQTKTIAIIMNPGVLNRRGKLHNNGKGNTIQ